MKHQKFVVQKLKMLIKWDFLNKSTIYIGEEMKENAMALCKFDEEWSDNQFQYFFSHSWKTELWAIWITIFLLLWYIRVGLYKEKNP